MRKIVILVFVSLLLVSGCTSPSHDNEVISSARSFLLSYGDEDLFIPADSQVLNDEIYDHSGDHYIVYFLIGVDSPTEQQGWLVAVEYGERIRWLYPSSIPPTEDEVSFLKGLAGWPNE